MNLRPSKEIAANLAKDAFHAVVFTASGTLATWGLDTLGRKLKPKVAEPAKNYETEKKEPAQPKNESPKSTKK